MKRFLVMTMFLLVIMGSNATQARAEENIEELTLKLSAITSYIERVFLLSEKRLSDDELRHAISGGVTWLKNAQEPSGHFSYEYEPYTDTDIAGDQTVRQAGALYALGEILIRDPGSKLDVDDAVVSAISFFEDISRPGEYDGRKFRCVADSLTSSRCQLGATSLATIGLLDFLTTHPDKESSYEDLLQDWKSFILSSQKENGGFRNIYRIGEKSQNSTESAFSNGEALLALVRMNMFEKDEKTQNAIDVSFEYLKNQEYDTSLYLWIMAALKDMHMSQPSDDYVLYAKGFTDWRINRTQPFKRTDRNYCAYTEGVVSAYSILEDTMAEPERLELRAEIDYWNTKNLRLQISQNDSYRLLRENETLLLKPLLNHKRALGGFLTSEEVATQRIDFTQHCISAYLQTLVDIDKQKL